MSEGGGGGPEVAAIKAPAVDISKTELLPKDPKLVAESIDTSLPDTPVHTDDPVPTIPVEEHGEDSSKVKEVDVKVERNAKDEVLSTKEMLRQKLTHDFIKASEADPEKKSESVIKGDLESNNTKLTPKQIELLEIYRKQVIIDPEKPEKIPSDEYMLKLIDTVRDQIAKEALERGLLSGSHLLPFVDIITDPELFTKLEQTAFIDNPDLISEVFASVKPGELDKIQTFLQEKANVYSTNPALRDQLESIQELIKLTPLIKTRIAKFINEDAVEALFKDIASGNEPELVKYISDFAQKPGGIIEIISQLSDEAGISFDVNFFQKHGKTIGKYGIFAALGLMYALTKSGKEQPQGAYH